MGWLGDEGPADEVFETLRHRPASISPRILLLSMEGVAQSPREDDAVQETWIRLRRSDQEIENLGGWLTTVVARVSLNMLRSRRRGTSGMRMPEHWAGLPLHYLFAPILLSGVR